MSQETRLHELLDLIEQSRAEGDKETEAKAIAAYKQESTPRPTGGQRARNVATGFNSGVAGLAGLPMDTALNVIDLVTAGVGYGASKFNNGVVPDAFSLVDRSQVAGSSEYLRNLMNKSNITDTRNSAPDDAVSRYLHTGGSALPGALLMRPSTVGQAASATTANVVPAMAAQAAADRFPDNPSIPILAGLGTAAAVSPLVSRSWNAPQQDMAKVELLKRAQKEGYVAPPSTTNPTMTNRMLESIGGKEGTAQDASVLNAATTKRLAADELKVRQKDLTRAGLSATRDRYGPAYQRVKQVGTITADQKFKDGIAKIADSQNKAGKAFPGLETEGVSNLIKSLDQPTFDADAGIEATRVLRDKASEAYARGEKTLGKAYRAASTEVENLIDRNLVAQGKPAQKMLKDFREARKEIAKTYSVEKALNAGSNDVSAIRLAKQLEKGAPLSGNLKLAAEFGDAFPKAARDITDSAGVRNTDVIVGGATAAASGNPAALAWPFGRMAVRQYLLSPAGQARAIPKPQNYVEVLTPEMRRNLLLFNQGLLSANE